MSRGAYSHDPQDTRDATPPRSPRQRPAPRAYTRDSDDQAPDIRGRAEVAEPRAQHSGSDERSDSLRAYYVRDRAYLLRDSEIHSLTEIGKFRVVASPDLARYEYQGDSDAYGKRCPSPPQARIAHRQDPRISRKKSLRVVTLSKAGAPASQEGESTIG